MSASEQDDFDDEDGEKTQIPPPKPNPGGRLPKGVSDRVQVHTRAEYSANTVASTAAHPEYPADPGDARNPLLSSAMELLLLIPRLKSLVSAPLARDLQLVLLRAHERFEQRAYKAGCPGKRVRTVSYILCTAIDEAARSIRWSDGGTWDRYALSLAKEYDQDGGRTVFTQFYEFRERPSENIDLLEVIYYAMGAGFRGQFRSHPDGNTLIEGLMNSLGKTIATVRGSVPIAPAEFVKLKSVPAFAPVSSSPLLFVLVLVIVTLAAEWYFFSANLQDRAASVSKLISTIEVPALAASGGAVKRTRRVSEYLQAEIAERLIAVHDEGTRYVIVIRSDAMFTAGSARLAEQQRPLIQRIGDAIKNSNVKKVMVAGYTDNTPIGARSQFPSNKDLSRARAEEVRKILESRQQANGVDFSAAGLGEQLPSTVAGQLNATGAARRVVEIVVESE